MDLTAARRFARGTKVEPRSEVDISFGRSFEMLERGSLTPRPTARVIKDEPLIASSPSQEFDFCVNCRECSFEREARCLVGGELL
jgi:hypothetical protein